MKEQNSYISLMNRSIRGVFNNALRISLENPSMIYFVLQTIVRQRKAIKLRLYWENKGFHIPPAIIASITGRCNLKCKGCYAKINCKPSTKEMTDEQWGKVFEQAKELGISIILLAGGEPFIKKEILNVTKRFPEIIFPVFTNGLLLNEEIIMELKKQKNVIPVISMEGFEENTNERRGDGVYENIQKKIKELNKEGIFFGVSLTITRNNFDMITDANLIKKLIKDGCKLVFFVEYVPMEQETENMVLADVQKQELGKIIKRFNAQFRGIFIAFPGDEMAYGGCLAAGRGFIHISTEGNLEPCPFAPYSDTNLSNISLREALQSDFLRKIRENSEYLIEGKGGCALWNNRDLVKSLMK
ncbi:MAG: radical SAM protein [bacterium]|nr:radical SAM protein [bacterium]